jgi:hypothetical protein
MIVWAGPWTPWPAGSTRAIGAKAIDAFGVDVARLHWDMTSISLYGT